MPWGWGAAGCRKGWSSSMKHPTNGPHPSPSPPPTQDLVKNHLMYAVREEVEVLKEQIKELLEKNSQLERENSLLKTLASPEQLEKFQSRLPSEVLQPQEQSPEPAPPAQHSGGSAV